MQVDPTAAAMTVATVATDYTNTIIGSIVTLLLSVISTGALLWKTTRDQNHQLRMLEAQSKIAAAERREQAALTQANQEVNAASIRERLALSGQSTAATVTMTAHDVKEDARILSQLQTIEIKVAIDEARDFMAAAALRAYNEANGVNAKLKALNEAHQKMGEMLERLLRKIEGDTVKKGEVGR